MRSAITSRGYGDSGNKSLVWRMSEKTQYYASSSLREDTFRIRRPGNETPYHLYQVAISNSAGTNVWNQSEILPDAIDSGAESL